MTALYFVFLLGFITLANGEQSAQYSCMTTPGDPNIFTMTFRLDVDDYPISRIFGGDDLGVASPGCELTDTEVVQTVPMDNFDYEITLTLDYNQVDGTELYNPTSCGATKGGVGRFMTWHVYSLDYINPDWRSGYDTKFSFTCNFAQATELDITFQAQADRAGFLDKPLTYTKEAVTLSVYDATGTNVIPGTINLGAEIRLGILLETRDLQATGIRAFIGEASGDGFSTAIVILKADGCAVDVEPVISSFTGSIVSGDFLLLTQPFNMVAIPGSTSLDLRFRIDYCYDVAKAECMDFCSTTSGKRRKRAAALRNETVATRIEISFDPLDKRHSVDDDDIVCYRSTWFIVVLGILGLLLLVVVVFATILCIIFTSRRPNKKEKSVGRHFDNPVYG